MLNLLLSICIGLANADRGNGRKGGKVITVFMMLISAYVVWHSWYVVLFPLPLLLSWWIKGGTGGYMRQVIEFLRFIPLDEGKRWRLFEFLAPFIYSLILLNI